ncbi:galactan 5-O-arabinofuranosyltransferase [Nocardia terpenica]|uniref:galactan 5-O-arabinofuranosyltransferase n=1 Tax=Nocardia terpenica TaxID=455432 RepID=UPI0015591B49|nr:galactan 5-O-arabinofuranosyltransferase [Nocardia terpenica]NQE88811.1 arabinofuranosyltransferase [Nocardia terpenica]
MTQRTAGTRSSVFLRQVGGGLGEGVLGAVVAVGVAAVGLGAFSTVHWPAFNSSNVTRALTTVGQVGALAVLVGAVVLMRVGRWSWGAKVLAWGGISGFVTVTLGMPLAATKLYLLGISVDQEFRTEYLTRFTDSAALHDMTYIDLPPYYPAGWFWLGGRVAKLLGLAGWEAFKPWAIVSLAVASVLAYVLWSKLIRADWAVAVGAATTVVMVAFASPEAYSAVLVIAFAPVMVLAWGALYRPAAGVRGTAGGWAAVLGTGLFLGVCAMFYTLFFGIAVFAVVLMAVVAWGALLWQRRSERLHGHREHAGAQGALELLWPILVRLIVIGAIAGVLTLVTWGPYWLKRLGAQTAKSGTAQHYLPETGARLSFPMFDFSHPLLAALCLVGTVWLVLRAASSRRAQALSIAVVAIYLWTLASMALTAGGSTLLSFRLEPILQVLLAAAGVFGFAEGARAIYQAMGEPGRFRAVAAAVAVLGAVAFAQGIPSILNAEITTAYTDTDGNGDRADRRAPSAVSYYREIDAALLAQTGRPRDHSVVLTADTSFLAYYPYYGFQAQTPHYANPLADFAGRAAEIKRWSTLHTPAELRAALHRSPWRAPDAFLFRRSGDGYTLRLSEDVYPNDPNVRRYTVTFPKTLFDDQYFRTTDIGPFTLVVAKP